MPHNTSIGSELLALFDLGTYPSHLSFVCRPCRTVSASANWHHARSIKLMTTQSQRNLSARYSAASLSLVAGETDCKLWPPLLDSHSATLALLSTFALASPCTDAASFSSSLASSGAEGDRSHAQCALLHSSATRVKTHLYPNKWTGSMTFVMTILTLQSST